MKKRRDFLKTTGAALGGIAISGIIPSEASAQVKPTRAGTISIHAGRAVKLETLQEAIKLAVGRVGCPACGLLGVDIHIGGGDPEPFNLPGVNATFTPRG